MPRPVSGADPLDANDDDAQARSIASQGSCRAAYCARQDDLKSAASLPRHAIAQGSPRGGRTRAIGSQRQT